MTPEVQDLPESGVIFHDRNFYKLRQHNILKTDGSFTEKTRNYRLNFKRY